MRQEDESGRQSSPSPPQPPRPLPSSSHPPPQSEDHDRSSSSPVCHAKFQSIALRCQRSIRPGETTLVIIPHQHQYWIEDGERWEFFWLATTGQEALRLCRAILAAVGPVFRLRPETIVRLASISLDLRDGKARSAGEASAMAYAATMALYDDLLGGEGGSRNARSRSIDRVLAQVRRRLHEPLDVQALADLAGLSRAHFSRVFKTCEGVPPAEFVLAERMRRAASLLVGGASNVKSVARDCGFRRPELLRQGFPPQIRRQSDRDSHDGHVFRWRSAQRRLTHEVARPLAGVITSRPIQPRPSRLSRPRSQAPQTSLAAAPKNWSATLWRRSSSRNLSHWPAEHVEGLRGLLKGGVVLPPGEQPFAVERSPPHGAVAAVLGATRAIGLDRIIGPKAA